MRAEQSNSSIFYGDRFILKLFRRIEPGINPDIEIGQFLTERGFRNSPPLTGSIEYRPLRGEPMSVAILQGFVPNQGDAWEYTLDSLSKFFQAALANPDPQKATRVKQHPLELAHEEAPPLARELMGAYLESARLLGQRTAEMHIALSGDEANPDFAPEPFSDFYRKGLYQGMVGLVSRSFQLLRKRLQYLPADVQMDARRVLKLEEEVRRSFQPIRDQRINTMRIRHHGDFHLGQLLYTGKDFIIIDFEGEPARALTEHRLKRSALRDVAGMLRSFQYASYTVLFGRVAGVTPRPEAVASLQSWADFWYCWVSAVYLKGYLTVAEGLSFLPAKEDELRLLLDAYLLEKAIYEMGYELNNRPDWVRIPLNGILSLVE